MDLRIFQVIFLCALAGVTIPLGGILARFEAVFPNWLDMRLRRAVISFGAGALLSAVTLVLVPSGIKHTEHEIISLVTGLGCGGLGFALLDYVIHKGQNSVSNFMAMLLDYVPESLALGAGFALGEESGMLLAFLIALQNLPEGFNAFRELSDQKQNPNTVFILLLLASTIAIGPIAGILGYTYLAKNVHLLGFIEFIASGGILYLVFRDLAPQASNENEYLPALGVVFGFLLGAVGLVLTH